MKDRFPLEFGAIQKWAFASLLIALALTAILILWPFMPALLWAAVLSALLAPLYGKRRMAYAKRGGVWGKHADTFASLFCVMLVLAGIMLPLTWLLGQVVIEARSLSLGIASLDSHPVVLSLNESISALGARFGARNLNLMESFRDNQQAILDALRGPVSEFLRKSGQGIFSLVIALLTLFFTLRDAGKLKTPLRKLIGIDEASLDWLLGRIKLTLHAVFSGTVLVAIVQGLIMGLTYWLLGVQHPVILGLVSILLCIIPLLGAPIIYFPVALGFFLNKQYTEAGIVLAVGTLIVSQIDNVLKPLIIGQKVQLHPMMVFLFVLGGIAMSGPIGLMVGPAVLTILLALYDLFVTHDGRPLPELEVPKPAGPEDRPVTA